MATRIIEINQIKGVVDNLNKKSKIVLVGGCFDVLHSGHAQFLKKAKEKGDILIVLLESDENIRKTKGLNRPIYPQLKRAQNLSALKLMDYVVLLPEMKTDKEYLELIKQINPKIIAVSKGDLNLKKKEEEAKIVGAEVVEVTDLIKNLSSSRLIDMSKSHGL